VIKSWALHHGSFDSYESSGITDDCSSSGGDDIDGGCNLLKCGSGNANVMVVMVVAVIAFLV